MRDFVERMFWTVLVAFLSSLVAAPVAGLDAVQVAAVTALSAAMQTVVVYARYRLSVLPDPGAGLPGLPVGGN